MTNSTLCNIIKIVKEREEKKKAKAYVERVVVLNEEKKETLIKATKILREIYDGCSIEFEDDNVPLRFYENSETVTNLLEIANNFPDD